MGAWSTTVLGSDSAYDAVADFSDLVGYPDDGDGWDEHPDVFKPLLEATPVPKLLEFCKDEDALDDGIRPMVAALMHMAVGAQLPIELRDLAITAARNEDCEDWSDPSARRKCLDDFITMLEAYNGTPVRPPEEGLFEKIANGMKGEQESNSARPMGFQPDVADDGVSE